MTATQLLRTLDEALAECAAEQVEGEDTKLTIRHVRTILAVAAEHVSDE